MKKISYVAARSNVPGWNGWCLAHWRFVIAISYTTRYSCGLSVNGNVTVKLRADKNEDKEVVVLEVSDTGLFCLPFRT